jgi:peroxiredoxin Q/BCP
MRKLAAWGIRAHVLLLPLCLAAPDVVSLQTAVAADLEINKEAPDFTLPNQDGKTFKLSDRKGKWTVVYFYPKAGSPGCTEQACAFRDAIKKIEVRNAVLVGISMDSQDDQKKFHSKHQLTFDLLADPKGEVLNSYGVKMPVVGLARRTTFIVDPNMMIRSIARDVDPAFDAEWSAETLDELQDESVSKPSAPTPEQMKVAPAVEKSSPEPEVKKQPENKKDSGEAVAPSTKVEQKKTPVKRPKASKPSKKPD